MANEPILPIFKPSDWDGRTDAVCRRLVEGLDPEFVPWVAFGYDRPAFFEFLKTGALSDRDGSLRSIERLAIENLSRRQVRCEQDTFPVAPGIDVRVLFCSHDFLAAERILDEVFLQKTQDVLDAELLAVGIPRRGVLIATNGVQDQRALAGFGQAVSAQYHRAESPPITPTVFGVRGGEIVGMLEGMEGAGRRIVLAERKKQGVRKPPLEVRRIVVVRPADGLEETHLCCMGEPFERVLCELQRATIEAFNEQRWNPAFSGIVRCWIATADPAAKDDRTRAHLETIEKNLRSSFAESGAQTASGRPYEVFLGFGDPPPR